MASEIASLTQYGWVGVFALAFFGLCVGSFLNVVIYRLPIMLRRDMEDDAREILGLAEETRDGPFNLSVPRSACPKCSHQIRAIENVPVFSWLVLRGRCSSCGTRISARYPLVEVTAMLLALLACAIFGITWLGLAVCVFSWMLLAAALIDIDTMLLPDQLTLPLLWLGLLVNLDGAIVPLTAAVTGAAIGYLSLWSIYWAFKLLTGKEGMGYGDFKLLGALGAWMGWAALPQIILFSSVAGLVFALIMMFTGRLERGEPMPFGPYLAAGGWLAMVAPQNLLGF